MRFKGQGQIEKFVLVVSKVAIQKLFGLSHRVPRAVQYRLDQGRDCSIEFVIWNHPGDQADPLSFDGGQETACHQQVFRTCQADELGFLKSFAITPAELEVALEEGMGFDGSAIDGFSRAHEADMLVKPDPTTFQILPWRRGDAGVARLFCDIVTPDGAPFDGDPRHVLSLWVQNVRSP